MLRVRLVTAAILLPLLLLLFTQGPAWGVGAFMALAMLLGVHEMAAMTLAAFESRLVSGQGGVVPVGHGVRGTLPPHWMPWIAAVIGQGLVLTFWLPQQHMALVVVVVIFLCFFSGFILGTGIELAAARASGFLISVCYAGLPWVAIWELYRMAEFSKLVMLLMAVTWMGDTGGYFGGRFLGGKIFGKRTFAPIVSPKKTWEGALSGLAMSITGAFALDAVLNHGLGIGGVASAPALLCAGLFGGIAEQGGDLLESLFKRFAGIKDSGTLIPGHGGLLDRIDGILSAAPVVWAVIVAFRD